MSLLSLVLSVLLAASFVGAFFLWRQKNSLQAILVEGARGYESLRSRAQYLEKSMTNLEAQVGESRKREEATRLSLSEVSTRAYQAETELDSKTRDFERRFRNVELQRDHMITQHDHIQTAYQDLSERFESLKLAIDLLKADNARLSQEVVEANGKATQKLRQENIELRKKITDLEREMRQAKDRPDVNPRDFDTLRRKVGQYEMLYNGMKSQKDMADERNRNWEGALLRLSEWILTKSSVAVPNDPVLTKGIGPIVGEALSRIGGELLSEDENEQTSDQDLSPGVVSEPSRSSSRLS